MSDSEKGTKENPYSYDEYKRLVDAGEWPGGYYRMETGPVAYAMPVTNVSSSSGYDGSGSDSGSDYYGSDELGSDTTNIETPGQPGDSTNTNPFRAAEVQAAVIPAGMNTLIFPMSFPHLRLRD